LSAVVRSHATQVPPPTPQLASDVATQTPLVQQPVGQVIALQTHVPPMHIEPMPQEAFPWHVHAPLVGSQVSVFFPSQGTQALPPMPQVATEGALQTPPEQQPLGQDCALQTQAPPTQAVPAPHVGFAPHWH
jgi:hypothetical protein